MKSTKQIISKFGKPTIDGSPYLVTIQLPYPMRLAWDLNTVVTKLRCHKLISEPLQNVFIDLLNHYGISELKRLRIDVFGGCFNYRKMRGGSDWSTHSWGIAVDLDPVNNQLKMGKGKATFSKPEYKPMMDIFYKWGFVNLGIAKGYDYMHFQYNDF